MSHDGVGHECSLCTTYYVVLEGSDWQTQHLLDLIGLGAEVAT